jgi:hypothetical protein
VRDSLVRQTCAQSAGHSSDVGRRQGRQSEYLFQPDSYSHPLSQDLTESRRLEREGRSRFPTIGRTFFHSLFVYALAFGIIWYLAKGIALTQLARNISMADAKVFVPASIGSFAIWFLGETFLFASLFSYFHRRTSFSEMLPANAAQYFLQLINTAVAGTALVLLMNRRKGVPWLAAGCTLIFQTLIDFQIMAAMALVAAAVDPFSLIRRFWQIPAVILAVLLLNTCFWLRRRPASAIGQWLYDRPSLISFRSARPSHYIRLAGIRTAIFLGYGTMLYFQVRGFQVKLHPGDVFSLLPAMLLVDGLPITPVGLGPVQAILVTGLATYAPRARLLAMALSVSFMNIGLQAALGLSSARTLAREVATLDRLPRRSAENRDS